MFPLEAQTRRMLEHRLRLRRVEPSARRLSKRSLQCPITIEEHVAVRRNAPQRQRIEAQSALGKLKVCALTHEIGGKREINPREMDTQGSQRPIQITTRKGCANEARQSGALEDHLESAGVTRAGNPSRTHQVRTNDRTPIKIKKHTGKPEAADRRSWDAKILNRIGKLCRSANRIGGGNPQRSISDAPIVEGKFKAGATRLNEAHADRFDTTQIS